jgi:hypothetical protein
MLDHYINLSEFRLGRNFSSFLWALNVGRFSIRRDISLIFLCGANQSSLVPSVRRAFIKKAVEAKLPHARIVYAEKVMEELASHGPHKNLLDIEHEISSIADWVLIVLESYSSFCELGAFADKKFRKKLIVINDLTYKVQPSFINHGPIRAIEEDVSPKHVMWYKMEPDGVTRLDSIGSTLSSILDIVGKRKLREKLPKDAFLPSQNNQNALFFLHDLIHLCGPITHAETISLYKQIFGDLPFDEVKALRGVLHASGFLESKGEGKDKTYISTNPETFIDFGHRVNDMVTTFRRFHLKYNPERLIG